MKRLNCREDNRYISIAREVDTDPSAKDIQSSLRYKRCAGGASLEEESVGIGFYKVIVW
jgi:hypothetical protein